MPAPAARRGLRGLRLAAAFLALVAVWAPVAAWAQAGLPKPDEAADLSLRQALAELDRSAGTVAAEVGPRAITWGDVADAIRAMPPSVSGMPPSVSGMPFPTLYQNAASGFAH